MSSDLLSILPLPILAVAGDCPKKGYRNTLSKESRRLRVGISSEAIIEFDLDFIADSLSRITVYVPHPSATFFQPHMDPGRTRCQDAALNFFLWLVDQRSEQDTFVKQ